VDGLAKSEEKFLSLTKVLDSKLIDQWTKDEEEAMRKRGKALRIFDMQISQGM
jgi:hypothetical protein